MHVRSVWVIHAHMNANKIKHDKNIKHAKLSSQIMYFNFVRVFSSLGEMESKKIERLNNRSKVIVRSAYYKLCRKEEK